MHFYSLMAEGILTIAEFSGLAALVATQPIIFRFLKRPLWPI
jgi:hypothetical protein